MSRMTRTERDALIRLARTLYRNGNRRAALALLAV